MREVLRDWEGVDGKDFLEGNCLELGDWKAGLRVNGILIGLIKANIVLIIFLLTFA